MERNDSCVEGLQEFVYFREVPASQITVESPNTPVLHELGVNIESIDNAPTWTRNRTLKLIEAFRRYKDQVGKTVEVKTKKKLWDIIVRIVGDRFTASQCENRWKTLERGYKKYVDNKKKTGTGRKEFEFLAEMEDIFGNKRNIHPILLLNSSTVSETVSSPLAPAHDGIPRCDTFPDDPVVDGLGTEQNENVPRPGPAPRRKGRHRSSVFDEYRRDKKIQHDAILQVYRERLSVEKEKVAELKIKNELLRERNAILRGKELKCACEHDK